MKKKKFLFNCTTNIVGGGLKNSAFFIKQAIEIGSQEIEWEFAVSKEVKLLLDAWGLSLDNSIHVFNVSPARNKNAREELLDLVKKKNPDLVYTMAGPAYVKFPVFHLQGISNPYITHANWDGFQLRGSFTKAIKYYFYVAVQRWFSTRAQHFVFQTEEARARYCEKAFIKKDRTSVISNAYDERMRIDLEALVKGNHGEKIIIVCPAAPYAHKALQFIPAIAMEMKKLLSIPFEFLLTIEKTEPIWEQIMNDAERKNVNSNIRTFGSYNYSKVTEVYKDADIVFVPSLVETFSATYLEAMAAKIPLVAADKGFARTICDDAALYINPKNAKKTAETLAYLINDKLKQERLIQNGKNVLEKFGNHKQRYERLEQLLCRLSEK